MLNAMKLQLQLRTLCAHPVVGLQDTGFTPCTVAASDDLVALQQM